MDEDERHEQEREEAEREAGTALLAWLQHENEKKRRLHESIEAGYAARESDRKENEKDGDE